MAERTPDHKLIQVYDALESGQRVKLLFSSNGEYLSFRSMLYKYKDRLDTMNEILYPEFEKLSIIAKSISNGEVGIGYIFSMTKKSEKLKFTFEILDDEIDQVENTETKVNGVDHESV